MMHNVVLREAAQLLLQFMLVVKPSVELNTMEETFLMCKGDFQFLIKSAPYK